MIPQLIQELVQRGITVEVKFIKDRFVWLLPNFGYKEAGCCYLISKEDDTYTLVGRYNTLADEIVTFDDLVYQNFSLWRKYNERDPAFYCYPDFQWLEDMVRLNLIEAETKTVTTYKIK